jgi:hypothetical protein
MVHFPDGLLELVAEAPEKCGLCRKPFGHRVSIYAGVANNGALAIVGDCCIDEMRDVFGVGVTERSVKEVLDA